MNALALRTILSSYKFQYAHETQLQEGIASVLTDLSVPFVREFNLSVRDRIDFLISRTGIEVKVGHPLSSVMRQVHRYMQSPELDDLLLVTNRCRHAAIPEAVNDKRIEVLFLGWGMLR